MTLEQTATRLLAGSSPGFTAAVTERLRATTVDQAATAEQHALDAAAALVRLANKGATDWYLHRAIEAIHHADWLWRRAQRINTRFDEDAA
jgi:hypothetical protein